MSDIISISDLELRFRDMVEKLNVEPHFKAFHTTPQHDGSPHVEAADGKFQYVVTERGTELKRMGGLTADEVLYLLFAGITAHIASSYELKNRVPNIDGRSVWFPYQERLMEGLDSTWGERLRSEHRIILRNHPFQT